MEIDAFCQEFAKKDPKLLMDYVQSAASGEVLFFPVTLSLVYDKLAGTVFPKDSPSNPDYKRPPEGQTVTTPNPSLVSSVASVPALPPTGGPTTPPSTHTRWGFLKCDRCHRFPQLGQLYDGLHCPWCPETGRNGFGVRGRPFMACSECNRLRMARVDKCLWCGVTFT